jgi:hypothetical protein
MTTITQQEALNSESTDQEWQPRPEAAEAVQEIKAQIAGWFPESEYTETETSIEFPVLFGQCTVRVSPIELDTFDGLRLSERFEARTVLSYVLDDFEDDFFDFTNLFATTGAALRCPDSGQMVLASGVSVFEQDTEALKSLYVPLIAWSSLAQSLSIQQALRQTFGVDFLGEKGDKIGLWSCDEPSFWQIGEFERAEKIMRSAGIYCNASDTGLAAEFPWEEGAVSAISGGQTSLLVLSTTERHPTAGNGMHFRLQLPVSASPERLQEMARSLNVLEMTGIDMPPSFGAWAVHDSDYILTYTGFWPNCIYLPGTAFNIAGWCMTRSRIARQFVGNRL